MAWRSLVLAGLWFFASTPLSRCQTPAATPDSEQPILWRIVDRCLDTGAPDYCGRCPSPIAGACAGVGDCRKITEIWAQTPEYAAIRDRKMCACPQRGFIHGLAIPRTRVTGIEDTDHRPAGLWEFAWDAARRKIADEKSIALAVNPRGHRTQNQLHIHIARLLPDARRRIMDLRPERMPDLHDVWAAAQRHAETAGLKIYGAAVVRETGGTGFLVVAVDGSPEAAFTQAVCPRAGNSTPRLDKNPGSINRKVVP